MALRTPSAEVLAVICSGESANQAAALTKNGGSVASNVTARFAVVGPSNTVATAPQLTALLVVANVVLLGSRTYEVVRIGSDGLVSRRGTE